MGKGRTLIFGMDLEGIAGIGRKEMTESQRDCALDVVGRGAVKPSKKKTKKRVQKRKAPKKRASPRQSGTINIKIENEFPKRRRR